MADAGKKETRARKLCMETRERMCVCERDREKDLSARAKVRGLLRADLWFRDTAASNNNGWNRPFAVLSLSYYCAQLLRQCNKADEEFSVARENFSLGLSLLRRCPGAA